MRRVELHDRQPGLRIKLKIHEMTRESFDKGQLPKTKSVNLVFMNKGQRFFAVKKTQGQLNEISAMIRKMLQ